jgi:O-antigen ligase
MSNQLGLSTFTVRLHEIALWCWGLMLLVVPFSTALALLFSAFGAFFSISGLRWNLIVQTLRSPVVLAALVLFAWLALSTAWSAAPRDELIEGIWKYRKLVFAFLAAASIFACRKQPDFLINFFLIGCGVIALGSLGSRFGTLELILGPPASTGGWSIGGNPTKSWMYIGGPDNPTFGRNHITQGAFLVFAAMFAIGRGVSDLRLACHPGFNPKCFFWLGLGFLYLFVVFSLQGRSGYLLTFFGALYWAVLALRGTHGLRTLASLLSIVATLLVLVSMSPHFYERSAKAVDEIFTYSHDKAITTSQAERLGFWRAGIQMAKSRPIFGYGVGGYAQAYSDLESEPTALRESRSQPHSEWILMLVQGGLIGLLIFGLLVTTLILKLREISVSNKDKAREIACVVALFFIYASFNSAIWDLAEGHFIALLIAMTAVYEHKT